MLDEARLGPALRDHAEHLDVAVRVDVGLERFGPAVEGAAFFAVTRCPTALPPGARPVAVVGWREGDVLALCGVPSRLAPVVLDQVSGLGGEVTTAGGVEGGRSR